MVKKKSGSPSSAGGKARAQKLSKKEKSEIARTAAISMWAKRGKQVPILAKYGAEDRPLKIGDIEIPCYVLADGRRVLAQRGLQAGLGLSEGGAKVRGERKLAVLMTSLEQNGVDTRGLVARINNPIRFIPPHGGNQADGHEASILPDICAVLIDAARLNRLPHQQARLAEQAALLQHGFATVGINALVDEATGYQDFRTRDALAKILEKFVAKELRPWVKTFPADYYRQIYRLNGWEYDEATSGRPGIVGHWTNNIVYQRLAPGVLAELKKVTPRLESGRLKHKLFQRLTDEVGNPKLLAHIAGVVMLMKYSPDWKVFMERLDKEYPQWGKTLMLPFPEDYTPPDA